MSTVIVAGSPRKNMFSDRIAEMAKDITGGKLHHLRNLDIHPCKACEACHTAENGTCIQKDDMAPLYQEVEDADTLVIVSPIYWWQVTAQTKVFIDRLYGVKSETWKGKKFIVILNGGAEDDDMEFQILQDAFQEMTDYLSGTLHYLGVGTVDEQALESKEAKVRTFLENAVKA